MVPLVAPQILVAMGMGMAAAMAVEVVTRVVNLGLCSSSRREHKQTTAFESSR
jgi:hypothetical protein